MVTASGLIQSATASPAGSSNGVYVRTDSSVLSETSLSVTIYEDENADGNGTKTDATGKVYNNSGTFSVQSGNTINVVTGFSSVPEESEYWIRLDLDNTDAEVTASLNLASVSFSTASNKYSLSSTAPGTVTTFGTTETTTSTASVQAQQATASSKTVSPSTTTDASVSVTGTTATTQTAPSTSFASSAVQVTAASSQTASVDPTPSSTADVQTTAISSSFTETTYKITESVVATDVPTSVRIARPSEVVFSARLRTIGRIDSDNIEPSRAEEQQYVTSGRNNVTID